MNTFGCRVNRQSSGRVLIWLATLAMGISVGTATVARGQLVTKIVPDGKPHKFETRDKQFFIDGESTLLVSGEMHFGRVMAEDWETRIKQAKAMGLNTISFYLFWNLCEPQEGKFDFSGMTDVRKVLKLCQENGMWAILRPGPYCCAEVEYGGIPYWTLKYPDVKIRTADPRWLKWCDAYIQAVYKQVGDLQVERGGPLLMTQIDNEYGITDPQNNDYLRGLLTIFRKDGFDGQLFTCNPTQGKEWTNPDFRLPGVMACRNGLKDDKGFQLSAAAIGDSPVFVPEVYTAWFSGWGEPIATRNSKISEIDTWSTYLLDHKYSFSLYMFYGGTNWGFNNGCNTYLPVQTSYDYGAPIDEAGRTTDKYRDLRRLFSQRLGINPPTPPVDPVVLQYPTIALGEHEALLGTLPDKPTRVSAKPVSMEDLNQDYGFVLYRKRFDSGIKGTLELKNAMDYTIVMVNGKTVAKAFRGYGLDTNKVQLDESGPVTLDLLVYNLGRISVVTSEKTQHLARKGLIDGAYLDGKELTDWQNYSLPMDKIDSIKPSTAAHTGPTLYHAKWNVEQVAGTFLDMRNWGFGVVWVNGHNLGRYWDRGGLRSLFVSNHFLKRGSNDIVVLELHDAPKAAEIATSTKIVEEAPVPFPVRLDRP